MRDEWRWGEGAALQKDGKDPTENLPPERGPAQLLRSCPTLA